MGQHILLVTSPKQIARLVAINLSKAGHHVAAAGSGVGGLRQAERRQPDVALVDPWLPDMDGTEFLPSPALEPGYAAHPDGAPD